jgi:acyl carrier protein
MVDKQELFEKVRDIIVEILQVDKNDIALESSFKTLDVDSLDKLEIVMKIEEQFGIEIDDEKAAKLETVHEAIDVINQLMKK